MASFSFADGEKPRRWTLATEPELARSQASASRARRGYRELNRP